MSDYIKREDAIKALEGWKISGEMILGTVQSADVVEVVRCADCVYRPCEMMPHSYDFDYCSFGERADT